MSKKKERYRDRHPEGKTRVGAFLQGVGSIAPDILDIAANVTGVPGLQFLADKIKGTPTMTDAQKELALKELDLDIQEAQEITKRWEADMKSDSWLSKNIRPLVVANFTLLIDFVIISSIYNRPLGEAYLPILMTMGITAIGGYFTLREYGKTQKLKQSNLSIEITYFYLLELFAISFFLTDSIYLSSFRRSM